MNGKIPAVPVLMYHEVLTQQKGRIQHTNPAYCLSEKQFQEQTQFLRDKDFRTLKLDDLLEGSQRDSKDSVVITFDDGFENNHSVAFPILSTLGLTATVFVVTDFIGKHNYLTWDNLKEMHAHNFAIESHTVTHRPLTELSIKEARQELEASKKKIEDALGHEVRFLSSPHGMINQRVLGEAKDVGYWGVCTSRPGLKHSFGQPSVFSRINVPGSLRLSNFEKIAARDPKSLMAITLQKGIKNTIKRALGYQNYRRLYNFRYRIKNAQREA